MKARDYWNKRYSSGGNSGYGSYDEQLTKKLKWLEGLDIQSVTEVGCGDFNFGSKLMGMYPGASYTGTDVSNYIISRNQDMFPQYRFCKANEAIPMSDLTLCIDVMFHVLDDIDYENLLKLLETLNTKYLAVTAYEYNKTQGLAPHVKIRKFDYKRFGEPIIHEVVEEDGQLFFYLFKKPDTSKIDISKVTCCLNTKETVYPPEVLAHVSSFGFGEILIKTHSESPYCKHELFKKAKFDHIYYQDDDAICPIKELVELSRPNEINVVMKQSHFDQYKDLRMTMGFGWGAIFPKSVLLELNKYSLMYGVDEVFKRDTEKLLTHLVFPQNRLVLPVKDLPTAMLPDRLSLQPRHYEYMKIIEERCRDII